MRAVQEEGYTVPTPIQAQAIPPALAGRDVLGCAQTGTGKTAAFALPILSRLSTLPIDKTRRGPVTARALILSPTRELAVQIGESLATYGRHTALRHTVIYGGVSQFHQERSLRAGVDIIVATPGRLIDLMEQGLVDLSQVKIFVLDEADRMLDMGFIQPIRRIASMMGKGASRQTLLFSATMPREIQHLADALLHEPVRVSVTPVSSAAPLIEQTVYMVHRDAKQGLLEHILETEKVTRAVVFTRTKHGADRVCRKLSVAGIRADAIHGDKAQNQRRRVLDGFKAGRCHVLVATDVAARGLDVDGITHVFNFDLPNEPEAYVHRIGRTGRAGATGAAISMCDGTERGFLRDIERLTGKRLPVATVPEAARTRSTARVIETSGVVPADAPMASSEREPRSGGFAQRAQNGAGGQGPRTGRRGPRRGQGESPGPRTHRDEAPAQAGAGGGHAGHGGHPGFGAHRAAYGERGSGTPGTGAGMGRRNKSWSKPRGR